MEINFDLKRKSLGLLCILWSVGLTFLLGVMAEGLAGGVTIFLTRSIFFFIVPPYAIWMLPCLLTGIYQLFRKKQESIDKIIFYAGTVLSILGLFFFFTTKYNPTTPHEHIALGLAVGAGLLVPLNGMWNVEIRKNLFSKIRVIATIFIILFLFITSYSAVYGRPITHDPMLKYLVKGNVYEEPGMKASATLELQVVDTDGKPIPFLEVCLTSEYQTVHGVGILNFCSYTNRKGVTIFKIPPGKYKVGFNFVNFPEKFTIPHKNIWIELKEGETTRKVIKLETK